GGAGGAGGCGSARGVAGGAGGWGGGAAREVEEEEAAAGADRKVAGGLEHAVPHIVGPDEPVGGGHADEARSASAVRGVGAGLGVGAREEGGVRAGDPALLRLVERARLA